LISYCSLLLFNSEISSFNPNFGVYWEKLLPMTMKTVQELAQKGQTGFKEI
jgi:hypothetical protein